MTRPEFLAALIIGILVAEAAVMTAVSRRRPLAFRLQWIANALAGMCFALALLVLLADGARTWLLAALAGALLSHLADVALRWRLAPPPRGNA
jgi:hypothetical protein